MKKIELHWQILIAIVLAIAYGLFLADYVKYVAWMGDIFMKSLKMVVAPLILTSIASGVANIGSSGDLGKLGFKTISYYLLTSVLAISTGLFMVNFIQPGVGADLGLVQEVKGLSIATESFGDTIVNIIPENIFEALVNNQMLSIIFFALLVGFFTSKLNEKNKIFLLTGVNAGFELMMKITNLIIKFTPFGVLGIVAVTVADQAGDSEALIGISKRLGLYMITVLAALIIHSTIVLPLILKFYGKINPLLHLKSMSIPLLTAFSTSSSSATLPLTMEAIENKAGVSNKVTSFVLPLGATINMDGTALYECIAAMFIAQAYGIELSYVEQIIVVATSLLASIGAAGIPMAGLVMISVVLTAVGLPLEGIGLILAVDRILDMFRTAVNVWSDSCGSILIAKSEGEILNYAKDQAAP
ncbi:MAG: dicarboxylate/amino acid:cation symporter [Flavobacteriaceae bacterium]|nr:dicarboxylate/amino acid:cation symporter [Flavobacteriaceae bacterium]